MVAPDTTSGGVYFQWPREKRAWLTSDCKFWRWRNLQGWKQLTCPTHAEGSGSKSLCGAWLEAALRELWQLRHGRKIGGVPQNRTLAVKVMGETEAPSMAAVSLWTPAWFPRVHAMVPSPWASVLLTGGVTCPSPATTCQTTGTLGTGLPNRSTTVTAGGVSTCWPRRPG